MRFVSYSMDGDKQAGSFDGMGHKRSILCILSRVFPLCAISCLLACCDQKNESKGKGKELSASRTSSERSEDPSTSSKTGSGGTASVAISQGGRSPYRDVNRRVPNGSEFKSKVTIQENKSTDVIPAQRLYHGELSLEKLPFWQREKVAKLRVQRQAIYDQGSKEGQTIRSASAQKRAEWIGAWNERERARLNMLRKEELAVLRSSPPEPTPDQVLDLLSRINGRDPVLSELDLPVIEYLLPSQNELMKTVNSRKPDDQVVRLLEAHEMLSGMFPQSVRLSVPR
jgi:hypothetical protein